MLTPVRAPPPGRAGYGCSHRPLVGRVRPPRPGPSPYPYPVARALSLLTTVCAPRYSARVGPIYFTRGSMEGKGGGGMCGVGRMDWEGGGGEGCQH